MTEVIDPTITPAEEVGDAARLAAALGRVRRASRRRVRAALRQEPLTEARLELLRLVAARPGTGIASAAAVLGLAPNTVSTLVGTLVGDGLLERRVDERDARGACLHLTAAARRRMARWRDERARLVQSGLDALGEGDRRRIAAALPALERLAAVLEQA